MHEASAALKKPLAEEDSNDGRGAVDGNSGMVLLVEVVGEWKAVPPEGMVSWDMCSP